MALLFRRLEICTKNDEQGWILALLGVVKHIDQDHILTMNHSQYHPSQDRVQISDMDVSLVSNKRNVLKSFQDALAKNPDLFFAFEQIIRVPVLVNAFRFNSIS